MPRFTKKRFPNFQSKMGRSGSSSRIVQCVLGGNQFKEGYAKRRISARTPHRKFRKFRLIKILKTRVDLWGYVDQLSTGQPGELEFGIWIRKLQIFWHYCSLRRKMPTDFRRCCSKFHNVKNFCHYHRQLFFQNYSYRQWQSCNVNRNLSLDGYSSWPCYLLG